MKLLERLFASPALATQELPPGLARMYDGDLGFDGPSVYANFVTSIDGVVAIPSVEASPSVISGKSEADRFVMGLLRACADVVLIGASTLRAEPDHRWTPEFVYPQATADYARLRVELGLAPQPRLAVLTSSGRLDADNPALEKALIVTTSGGARSLEREGGLPEEVLGLGDERQVDLRKAIDALRSRGLRMVLCEGGPRVIGQLLDLRLLDELFLTISPILLGRTRSEARPGLTEGIDLLHRNGSAAEVLSLHRHRSHLFLRYALGEQKGVA